MIESLVVQLKDECWNCGHWLKRTEKKCKRCKTPNDNYRPSTDIFRSKTKKNLST
jgi:hypothetical protein